MRGRFGRPRTSQVKQLSIQTTSKLCLNLHFTKRVENCLLVKEIFLWNKGGKETVVLRRLGSIAR